MGRWICAIQRAVGVADWEEPSWSTPRTPGFVSIKGAVSEHQRLYIRPHAARHLLIDAVGWKRGGRQEGWV